MWFSCPMKAAGQEWQNPDLVEISSKSSADFSDFTPYFRFAERSLWCELWALLTDGKLDTGTFSC